MDQEHKLLKQQELIVLKDPFPEGQNTSSASKNDGAHLMLLLIKIISTWSDPVLSYRQETKTMN